MRKFLSVLLLLSPITAFALNITLIHSEDSRYQSSFANTFAEKVISKANITLTNSSASSLSIALLKTSKPDIIISLDGSVSEQIIAAKLQIKSFHALTTLSSAGRNIPCLPHCLQSLPLHRFFVLDQPPERQLNLIKLINPAFKTVGVIVTEQSKAQLKDLKRSAQKKSIAVSQHVSSPENVRYQIDDVSKSADVILAIADTDIYNAASLSQILLTSYRYKTPIIGFSRGFVKAGAIAGNVSSIDQLAQHLTENLSKQNTYNLTRVGNVIYPKYFDVISNRNVAKSLNLHFPEDPSLKEKLKAYETSR